MISGLNRYQLELMMRSIYYFEQEKLNLDSLLRITRSLEELLDSLKNIDPVWKSTFRIQWGELEITSAMMMDQEVDELMDEEKVMVKNAIENIKVLIKQVLA